MNIYKIEDHQKIIKNEKINQLIRMSMFNPTDGRVKTTIDGIYGKQQGSLYVCEIEEIVAIVGCKRVDNAYVQIMHLIVDESFRKQGIAKVLIEYVKEAERVDEIIIESDGNGLNILKSLGFKFTKEEDNMTGLIKYTGRQKG